MSNTPDLLLLPEEELRRRMASSDLGVAIPALFEVERRLSFLGGENENMMSADIFHVVRRERWKVLGVRENCLDFFRYAKENMFLWPGMMNFLLRVIDDELALGVLRRQLEWLGEAEAREIFTLLMEAGDGERLLAYWRMFERPWDTIVPRDFARQMFESWITDTASFAWRARRSEIENLGDLLGGVSDQTLLKVMSHQGDEYLLEDPKRVFLPWLLSSERVEPRHIAGLLGRQIPSGARMALVRSQIERYQRSGSQETPVR